MALDLIDVHTHFVPSSFPACPDVGAASHWPSMKCHGDCRGTIMTGDKPFRELDDRSWNVSRRLEDMDRDGVAMQVLSPMPELLSYWIEPKGARLICEHGNAQIADMVAQQGTRFRGLGSVPMQDVGMAIDMLAHLKPQFGLSGVEIGSNINGVMLGDRRFEPFWEAVTALDLAVFVHALHPVATKSLDLAKWYTVFCGFPIDVGMAAASLITSGVLHRHPTLRIAFSHGGGALSSVLGRLDKGWKATKNYGVEGMSSPSDQAAKLFFDSNVYDPAQLAVIANRMAPGRVMTGTDYPYPIMQEDPAGYLQSAGLSAETLDSVSHRAARLFLGD